MKGTRLVLLGLAGLLLAACGGSGSAGTTSEVQDLIRNQYPGEVKSILTGQGYTVGDVSVDDVLCEQTQSLTSDHPASWSCVVHSEQTINGTAQRYQQNLTASCDTSVCNWKADGGAHPLG